MTDTPTPLRDELLRIVSGLTSWEFTGSVHMHVEKQGYTRIDVLDALEQLAKEGRIDHKRERASDLWRARTAPSVAVAAPASVSQKAPLPAQATHTARRPQGETRQRVADYLEQNPEAESKEIAKALSLAASTVYYHREMLDRIAAAAVQPSAMLNEQPAPVASPQPARAPAAAPSAATVRYALWSTGELVIERDIDNVTVLPAEDTRALFKYLDTIRGMEPAL